METLIENQTIREWRRFLGALACLALVGLCGTSTAAAGGFKEIGFTIVPREQAAAHLLPNGKVLFVGGYTISGDATPVAELFDPATRSFSTTGSMAYGRAAAASAELGDGRVLVAGGTGVAGDTPSAEVYDPGSGLFSSAGPMNVARVDHTATRMNDGKVLIVGGRWNDPGDATAEVYNPATGGFASTGSMSYARFGQTATLLLDGKVLVAGGASTGVAELYDPAAGTFTPTGSMKIARSGHSAIRLYDGRVLIIGGNSGSGRIQMAEIYDPATKSFSAIGLTAAWRLRPALSLLQDGRVLISGTPTPAPEPPQRPYGWYSTELFSPATGKFTPTWNMVLQRNGHNAVTLRDGKVLVAHGRFSFEGYNPAELFTPTPPPENGKSVNVEPVSGKVMTRCKGDVKSTTIEAEDQIKVGCQVNVRSGTVKLVSAKVKRGTQSAHFRGGVFKVTQKKGKNEAVLTMNEPMSCGKKSKRSLVKAAFGGSDVTASAKKKKGRKLWGKGKGRFKTKGKKGSATVRGTEWMVEDRCNGTTFFKVKSGVVTVKDNAKKKPIKLTAGKSYVAGKKAKKKRRR